MAVTLICPEPATTKLPDNTSLPDFLSMGLDSPVRRLSSTSRDSDLMILASTTIWLPAEIMRISSRTMSSWSIESCLPSRMAVTLPRARMESLSRMRLARSSWKMPMPVLMMATPKKRALAGEPTNITAAARRRLMVLNGVKMFFRMILLTVAVDFLKLICLLYTTRAF